MTEEGCLGGLNISGIPGKERGPGVRECPIRYTQSEIEVLVEGEPS